MNIKEYNKKYKKEHKKLVKHAKDFKYWDFIFNLRLFVQSLRITLMAWEQPGMLVQIKDEHNNFDENLEALRKTVAIGDKLVEELFDYPEQRDELYKEFWNLLSVYFTAWWD